MKRTTNVLTFVMVWSMYRAAHEGQDPADLYELADEIAKNWRTLYRWQEDFRAVFAPEGWQSPGQLLDALSQSRSKVYSPRTVGKWSVS